MATAAAAAAGLASRSGVKAAAAASGAGAIASSSADQVAASGSALSSADMVMIWAPPASRKAPRRQYLLLKMDGLIPDVLVADLVATAGCGVAMNVSSA
jgi:hypothetical protein